VENPHEYYAFSTGNHLEAVMTGDGKWKLHVPHGYRIIEIPGEGGMPGKYGNRTISYSLYNLEEDPYEKHNVIEENPEIAEELKTYAEAHRERFYGE
jgi:hypothetical protein